MSLIKLCLGNSVSLHGPASSGNDGEGFNASVVIDGGPLVLIPQLNQPATTITYNNQLFISELSPGNHTLVLTTHNAQPFYIDYFLFTSALDIASSTSAASSLPAISATPTISALNLPSPIHSGSKSTLTAGAVGGGVGGLIILAMILFGTLVLRRRFRGRHHPGKTHFISEESLCSFIREARYGSVDPFLLSSSGANVSGTEPPPLYTRKNFTTVRR